MGLRVEISFKKSPRDLNLYNIIQQKGDKSNFIKDAVEFYLDYLNNKKILVRNVDKDESKDDIDVSAVFSFINKKE